jgi:hypothetical protein
MTDLRQRVPLVRRAREYHLYTLSGRRYLDLWQNGGRSLLGHRPGRLTTVLKNTISKGLIADLPSVYGGRLQRLLHHMFPGCSSFRVAGSPAEALQLASLYLGRTVEQEELSDPAAGKEKIAHAELSFWRPLLPGRIAAEVLFPILPFGMGGAPEVVCFRGDLPGGFPEQGPLSGVLLAGLLRCLRELQRFRTPEWLRRDLLAGCTGWRQRGIYVAPDFDLADYQRVFEAFLEAGVLLSPEAPYVSILPSGELSKGERGKMIGLFRAFPGK